LHCRYTTSQNINLGYGYLWWLNGKKVATIYRNHNCNFQESSSAPNDMYMALGKNDQKIYVIPSKNMVVRMGDAADM
jgi:hypothetical protein